MILSRLADADVYGCLGKRFQAALMWLSEQDPAGLEQGRHVIDGDDLFALVQENLTRYPEEVRWEAHRKYADIQWVLRGTEAMGVGPLAGFRETTPYDSEKDVAFFLPNLAPTELSVVNVTAGSFAIFLPTDVHQPLLRPQGREPESVLKVVVKVRV